MNWKLLCVLFSCTLILGCGSKKNFIVLTPAEDGSVGALQVENPKGSAILDEEGKAIYIADKESAPSEPTAISGPELDTFFKEALQVHPLMPQSFLLYFRFNSNQLAEESQQKISEIQQAIKDRDSTDIEIIGHTDRTGSDAYNQQLSLKRAQAVQKILTGNGVNGDDITITYYGEGNPLIPTADNVSEPRNRRVEVMIR